jgi:membrane-bound lytic murein transglycosylase B
VRRAVAALCFAALLGACSDDGPETTPRTVASTSSSTTSTSTTTTAPTDPATALAMRLVTAETAIRNPSTPPAQIVGHAAVQQDSYRELASQPEWVDQVLTASPPSLHGAIRANLLAAQKLRQLSPPKKPAPPEDWRIVAAAPADELQKYYREAETEFGVPWQYLAAVHLVETRMGRIRGASSAGALGPMQFLPSTWEAYGEGDINSNRDSIRAAARYLKRNGAPGDMRNALWNYNHSYLYVDAVTAYAEQMRADERTYLGYYNWRVYYRTTNGDVLLPEGYPEKR